MPATKRHHYVPILHLKHFAGSQPKGHVWTYDAQTDQVRSAKPDQIAFQGHFYSTEAPDGTVDTRIETFLSRVESHAMPVYENLLKGVVPTESSERGNFAMFLALMHFRTPSMRRMRAESYGKFMQLLTYKHAENENVFEASIRRFDAARGQITPPEMREKVRQAMLDPSQFIIEISKEMTLTALRNADDIAPYLYKMKWTVVIAAQGYFITSDNPVTLHGSAGFALKTTEVSFPLSPKVMLLLSWKQDSPGVGVFRRPIIEAMNDVRAANSERFLYAHLNDKRLRRRAAEFKGSRPTMSVVSGFGPKNFARVTVGR